MRRNLVLLLALLCGLSQASVWAQEPQAVTTVDSVDLNRYVGLWHEIARIPNRFQKQCASGTTAEYMLRRDGKIDVVNRCVKADGKINQARGVAKIVDTQTRARLKVSFVSFLGIRPFWGDYWVIGLAEDYSWAAVGTPNRKYGWILGRAPALPEETMKDIFALLRSQGYDPADFVLSPS